MTIVETRVVPVLQRDGPYVKFGSLTTGSGFAYGAGFRDRALVDGRGGLDLWAAGSLKRYWAIEARGGYPIARAGALTRRDGRRVPPPTTRPWRRHSTVNRGAVQRPRARRLRRAIELRAVLGLG